MLEALHNPKVRAKLSQEELAAMPANPAGQVEFVDFEMEDLLGGLFPGSSSFYLGECCFTPGDGD
ncbi:mersacidin/lichenicidin family type 2 lantibiotic [Calidithermus terrae]|uniref:mersacidin/lichenicidin family type 2 lantibiotic n=1 Tax=Calidithermus terrae TaxID=1408545 RepID=UPI003B8451DE